MGVTARGTRTPRARRSPHRGRVLQTLGFLAAAALAAAAVAPPRRVVVVSFDGLGGRDLAARLARGELSKDGFARAEREGFSAERLVVVTPSQTAVSHASISAGAPPSRTGIVANWFHPAGTPLSERVSGFQADPGVETLWEAAARQGKRVASIAWPGVPQRTPRTTTAIGLQFIETRKKSVLWNGPTAGPLPDLTFALPVGLESFSPPKRLPIAIEQGKDAPLALTFVAVDTTDDGRRSYDQVLALDSQGALAARVRPGDWFEATERRAQDDGDRDVVYARWGKLLALSPDLTRVKLYVGPASRNRASPEDFRRTLDRRAGVFPEQPDPILLEGSHPETASFVEQAERFARYFVEAFAVARRRGDWQLLLAYQPIVDEAEHALLLVDPRHPAYTKELAAECAGALRQVIATADRAAAAYLSFADEGDVVFVSDHGMRPVARAFSIREALRRKGWIKVQSAHGGVTVAEDSPVDVVRTGGTAFVYVNRALPGMSEERAAALAAEIAEDLRARRDPSGEPLFSLVLPRGETARYGLDHPNAGDLVAIAKGALTLETALSDRQGESLLTTPDAPGQHGYEPDPALDGIFFHVGRGIARQRVASFDALDVAARVAARLSLAPFGAPR